MRLISFRHGQDERIGILIEAGILDLSRVPGELPGDMKSFLKLGEAGFAQARNALSSFNKEWLMPVHEITLLAPIPNLDKILCIGHNYSGHIGIGKTELPEYPNLFCKTVNTIIADQQAIVIPEASNQVDFEAELIHAFLPGRHYGAFLYGCKKRHCWHHQSIGK